MLYPLKFLPVLKFYPYGGRRFFEILEQDVPRDRDVAQNLAIVDNGKDQSIVVNGPLAGRSLHSLMEEFQAGLVGQEVWESYGGTFPLRIKFVDTDKRMPAHLHPNDAQAQKLGLGDRGKTEAWYIMRADAGAQAFCGAKPNLNDITFRFALAREDGYDGVMKSTPTRTDDSFLLPPGRPHALDSANLTFVVETNSDAVLGFEWKSFIDAGLISPALAKHQTEGAIESAVFEDGLQEQTRQLTLKEGGDQRTFCVACRHFVLERLEIGKQTYFQDEESRFNTFTLIGGAATFTADDQELFAMRGESILVPADCEVRIVPNTLTNAGVVTLLRTYVPQLQRDVVDFLRGKGIADEEIAWLGSYGASNDLLPLLGLPTEIFNATPDMRHQAAIEHRDSRDETS